MSTWRSGPLRVNARIERFPLREPFRITGYTLTDSDVVVVTLECNGHTGYGEASGVYYRRDDDPDGMVNQIEAMHARFAAGIDRDSLQWLMPGGGARNAVDCAMWDLEAKCTGRSAWQIAGLRRPQPLVTTFTVGANDPDKMAADARAYTQARALKLKLTGDPLDAYRVEAVRAACPDAWLGIDANQGFTRQSLDKLMAVLTQNRVQLIEQPFAVGQEAQLEGYQSPIPIAADESVQGLADLQRLVGRFDVVNIKLDKCGGLTEALAMADTAKRMGFDIMVGNMAGTSLAMAPALILGQLCKVVDLDGPLLLRGDRSSPVTYQDGMISDTEGLWGRPNDRL